jgi:hypothetical protein
VFTLASFAMVNWLHKSENFAIFIFTELSLDK